jgi:hypothetical protein
VRVGGGRAASAVGRRRFLGLPRRKAIEPFGGSALPASAARRYQPRAWATPWPCSYIAPKLCMAAALPVAAGFLEPMARLGVVVGDPPAFDVQQPEHVHRLRGIGLGPRWARRGRPTGAVPASGQGVYPAFEPAPATRGARARKGSCVRWFFIIWVSQVSFGKSFAARPGRFWLAGRSGGLLSG